MHEIIERHHLAPVDFHCAECNQTLSSCRFWSVDHYQVCDECFVEKYDHLVKCSTSSCIVYGDEDDFRDGMCESCEEVNTPLDPEAQEGWEHNIRRWNEG